MANLKNFLISLYEKSPETFDLYELPYEMKFKSLPMVKSDEIDEEVVDFENTEILNIDLDNNTITIVAGGDWQTPTKFSVVFKDDGFFHYEGFAIFDVDYEKGLSTKDVIKMIGK